MREQLNVSTQRTLVTGCWWQAGCLSITHSQSIGASTEEQPRRSERDQSTSLTKDSISVQVSLPNEVEHPHTSRTVLSNHSPSRVHSDLTPKPRSEPQARDGAPLRRSYKEHTDTLATKNRNNLLRTAGSQSKRAEKGSDERARDNRIAELEQERDEYRAGLRKEKARSADLGQQILLLQSSRLTAHEDEVAAQVRDLQRQRKEAAASLRAVQDEKTTLVKKTEALEAEVTRLRSDLKSQRSQDESKMDIRNNVALEKEIRKEKDTKLKMNEKMETTSKETDALKRTIDKLEVDINSKKTEGEHAKRQIDSLRSGAAELNKEVLSLKSTKENLTEQLELTQEQLAKSRTAEGKALQKARAANSENSDLKMRREALRRSLNEIRKSHKEVQLERGVLRDSTARLQHERDEQDRKMREKEDDMRDMKEAFQAGEDRTNRTLQESQEVRKALGKKCNEQEEETRNMVAKIMDLQASVRRTELVLGQEEKEKSTMARTIEGLEADIDRMKLALREEGEEKKRLAKEMKEVFSAWFTGPLASPS